MAIHSRQDIEAGTWRQARRSRSRAQELKDEELRARKLGWFSIGLGLAEILMPRRVERIIGLKNHHGILMRFLGARKLANGIGIFSQRRPAPWVWARVVGDVMDIVFLGRALGSRRASRGRVAFATAAVAGVTALDCITAQRLTEATRPGEVIFVTRAVTINRPPEELYRFWHNFQNLPKFMKNVESVQVLGPTRSHWVVRAPGGFRVEWNSEIVTDTANELIAWRSTDNADVENAGSVLFVPAPGGRGTQVIVELQFKPSIGGLGASLAKLFGKNPSFQMQEDLRRFKQLMETGEIATTEGQPSGPRGLMAKALLDANKKWRV